MTAQREWVSRAACAGLPTEVFFLDDNITNGGKYEHVVFEICGMCRVRNDCLAVALTDPTIAGVWGGTTENQRRKLRRAA